MLYVCPYVRSIYIYNIYIYIYIYIHICATYAGAADASEASKQAHPERYLNADGTNKTRWEAAGNICLPMYVYLYAVRMSVCTFDILYICATYAGAADASEASKQAHPERYLNADGTNKT
eukprot:COSAG05_NODE_137_length_16843_cov_121.090779_28_plen_119_part_01